MRHATTRPLRRALLAAVLMVLGAGALGPSAVADVQVSPSQAVQGQAASVTFAVRNDRPGVHTTKVRVDLPSRTPVAEVYPMSVADWAPTTVVGRSDQRLPGIHGAGLTQITTAIVWTRAADAPPPPPTEELRLEMGPMPAVESLVFAVTQTYSDGTVARWAGPSPQSPGTPDAPGTVLTLVAPESTGGDSATPASGAHAGHHAAGMPAGSSHASSSAPSPAPAAAGDGDASAGSPRLVLGVLALVAAAALLLLPRMRRSAAQQSARGP